MRAARIHAFGTVDQLRIEQVERPSPGPNDILVRVAASGINPIEWKIRAGDMGQALRRPLPATVGWECAGVVEAVGDGVTSIKPGDAVFAYPEFAREGTHADYVTIAAAQAAPKPSSLSFVEAAAVPMTAQAAWTALDAAQLHQGERVLIHGAGGAVGHWLTQLAKRAGVIMASTLR